MMKFVLPWFWRHRSERHILLVCSSVVMAEYLAEIWEILQPDPCLRFWVLPPHEEERRDAHLQVRRLLPLRQAGKHWVRLMKWDLMIVADHAWKRLVHRRRCPTLRISHGVPGKRVDGELYAFGTGAYDEQRRLRYTRMFVSSDHVRNLAVAADPALGDIVAVVGIPGDDKTLAHLPRRREYREQFGFSPSDVVVFVMSTWGPDNLFNRMGDKILEETRRLRKEFRFILTTHPHEYRPAAPGQRVWGEHLRSQRAHGFVVREPSESWIPYMVACDVILTDHTALALHGVPLRRPVVVVPIPDEVLEQGGPIWRLREISPMIKEDASDLRDCLWSAKNNYPFDRLEQLARELNSYPGNAAGRIREEVYKLLGMSPVRGCS